MRMPKSVDSREVVGARVVPESTKVQRGYTPMTEDEKLMNFKTLNALLH